MNTDVDTNTDVDAAEDVAGVAHSRPRIAFALCATVPEPSRFELADASCIHAILFEHQRSLHQPSFSRTPLSLMRVCGRRRDAPPLSRKRGGIG